MRSGGQKDRVIVFCRYPVPGKTKTRLIPVLGRTGAAELHRRLTEEVVSKVRSFSRERSLEAEICFEGGSERQMKRWLGEGLLLSQQVGGDLGGRMRAAFENAFRSGCRRVVLHGADIPGLEATHLHEAFEALEECDLVLGPSTDGGYWLMGLRGPADLFEGISWGSENVLQETLRRGKMKGLRVRLMNPLTDIDTPDQMREILPRWKTSRPYISVIIPTLNEGKNIQSTIRRASGEESEVIVVDAESVDGTGSKAAEMGARVLRSRPGRGVQQNLGAGKARGDVLLFLHGDTLLPEDYPAHVFEILLSPEVRLGAFRFKTDIRHPMMRLIEAMTNFRSRYLMLPYGDQALFMRRSVFEEEGGFPECPIGEDFFLVRRLSKKGRIEIAPVPAVTSGRRWRELGIARTTLINQLVGAGLLLNISTATLARLYGRVRLNRTNPRPCGSHPRNGSYPP